MFEQVEYGVSTGLFVNRMANNDTFVLGGEGEGDKWTRVLSDRSAHTLWYHLTQLFFLERARDVLSVVTTAPLRGTDKPTITTDVNITITDDGLVKLTGTTARHQSWTALLTAQDARRLWQTLDRTLYPFGWEGASFTAMTH
ncbi:MAG: hypothetical protein JXB47_04365 [Anaerolineae bacterium]|nr:hypothetical protein [Anaerolineae bacterium]